MKTSFVESPQADQAYRDAELFVRAQNERIIAEPKESAIILFDMLADTYRDRMVAQRIHYGDEIIDSAYIATRMPDNSGIDEVYAVHEVSNLSADTKQVSMNVQRSVTLLDGKGGFRRIIVDDDGFRAVDDKGRALAEDAANDTLLDFVFRTHQAIATYTMRSRDEQREADTDAKTKLRNWISGI